MLNILRAGLLDGRRVAFAGADDAAIPARLQRLGVWVDSFGDETAADQDAVAAWVTERLPLHALVHDARSRFGSGGTESLQDTLERMWITARAALENLSRTLSVEWARFAVTAVTIWPGARTTDDELAELVSFLLSDAGGYFTGCRFELGAAA